MIPASPMTADSLPRLPFIKDTSLTPPGGWVWACGATSSVLHAGTFSRLVETALRHLAANSTLLSCPVPPERAVSERLSHDIATRLLAKYESMVMVRRATCPLPDLFTPNPHGAERQPSAMSTPGEKFFRPAAAGGDLPPVHRRDMSDRPAITANSCLSHTFTALRASPARVPALNAACRAEACLKCQFNVQEPACYSCYIAGVFAPLLPDYAGEGPRMLGVCSLDLTFSRAMVYGVYPPRVVYSYPNGWPEWCWKRCRTEEPTRERATP